MRPQLLFSAFVLTCSSIIAVLNATAQESEATSVGGYGEIHFNEPDGISPPMIDFHRFVLYIGHTFDDRISFKSELELEHTRIEAGDDDGGELAIEQAYLDWHLGRTLGIRAGILLPPVGIINQIHEPPTFNGVERPAIDRVIIPTTWRESGAGIYGTFQEGIFYQLYVVAGLNASGFDGSSGIRNGRQKAFESSLANPSVTGRIDYLFNNGMRIGGSFFAGNTTGGIDSLGTGVFSLVSADLQHTVSGIGIRIVGVYESLGDAESINAAFRRSVGSAMYGFSVEGMYDILPLIAEESDASLHLFGRFEKYDTHARVSGILRNPLFNRHDITFGATYNPTYNTVAKIDYQFFRNAADRNSAQFNVGVGYNF